MKLFRLIAAVCITMTVCAASAHAAAIWTPYVTITYLQQSNASNSAYVFVSPAITTGCTNSSAIHLEPTNQNNGGGVFYPDGSSLMPMIMASFLFNKPISFFLLNCDTDGDAVITGVSLAN